MSLRLVCPNGHELIADVAAIGQKVRCPACKLVLLIPDPNAGLVTDPPAPPSIAADTVRTLPPPLLIEEPLEELKEVLDGPAYAQDGRLRKQGMKTGQRLRLANVGLGFHYAKVLCMLLAISLFLLIALLGPLVGPTGPLPVLGCLSLVLVVITPVLGGTGSLLCFWLPKKSNARVLVIVSFGLEVGGVLLMLLATVLSVAGSSAAAGDPMAGGPGGTGAAVAGFGGLLMPLGALVIYASFILFLVVLRILAGYLRDDNTADEAMRQLILYLIITLGGGVIWGLLLFALILLGRAGLFLMFFVTLGWIVAIASVLFAILKVIATLRALLNRRYG